MPTTSLLTLATTMGVSAVAGSPPIVVPAARESTISPPWLTDSVAPTLLAASRSKARAVMANAGSAGVRAASGREGIAAFLAKRPPEFKGD